MVISKVEQGDFQWKIGNHASGFEITISRGNTGLLKDNSTTTLNIIYKVKKSIPNILG
jgi:hypothetical protein